jgi:hypothetical protein
MAAGLLLFCLVAPGCSNFGRSGTWTIISGSCPKDESSSIAINCAIVALDPKSFSKVGENLELPLPGGTTVDVTPVETQSFEGKGVVWHGVIAGKKFSDVTFSTVRNAVVGTIAFDGHMYRLRPVSNEVAVIEELNSSEFLTDAPKNPEPTDQTDVEPPTLSCTPGSEDCEPVAAQCSDDDPDQIDVLVLYTDKALSTLKGVDSLNAWTILQVYEANRSYKLSNLTHQIRLVAVVPTAYIETSNDLSRDQLVEDSSPLLNAHAVRNDYNADIVVLLTQAPSAGGAGYAYTFTEENIPGDTFMRSFEPYAYAVVDALGFETTDLTFPHELGHLMGAEHDASSSSSSEGAIPGQSHGYFDQLPNSDCVPFMTIMTQRATVLKDETGTPLCPATDRLVMWSNTDDDTKQDGKPVGSATAKNRDSLKLTAPIITKFRCGLPSPGKVWMKDNWNDSGMEPDPGQGSAEMWKSPYIWVRNSEDAGPDYPAQHLDESPIPGQVNFVYAKLQNDGDQAEGKLEFWVAEAATTLVWPDSFTMKGVVQVPDFPAHSTLIPPPFKWNPSGNGPFSLLARWISSADTIPTPEPPSVDAYVRGSNNVVWRSMNVVTLATGAESAPIEVGIDNLVENRSMNSLVIKPSDANPAHTFFRYGEIILQLDDSLLKAWERTGYQGRGFERSGRRLRITDPNGAVLEGMMLDPGTNAKLQMQFRLARNERARGKFHVDVIQQQLDEIGTRRQIGGIGFEVQVTRQM